jgi:hypothetical protein
VNRFLESEADICELRLAGATIAMVRIANHYVELLSWVNRLSALRVGVGVLAGVLPGRG